MESGQHTFLVITTFILASVSSEGRLGRLENAGRWYAGLVCTRPLEIARGDGGGGDEGADDVDAKGDDDDATEFGGASTSAMIPGGTDGSCKGDRGIGGRGGMTAGASFKLDPAEGRVAEFELEPEENFRFKVTEGATVRLAKGSSSSRYAGGGEQRGGVALLAELKPTVKLRCRWC